LQDRFRASEAQEGKSAVSIFNLLAYHDGKREVYIQYIDAFGASVGKAAGSEAKIIGHVTSYPSTPDGEKEWEDAAIVHYPSIHHFADLVASEEYQNPGAKYKAGSIKDTCILCLTEL
jgi:uncharacterized protein (DUF1330 family)